MFKTVPSCLLCCIIFASAFQQYLAWVLSGFTVKTRYEQCVDEGFNGSCEDKFEELSCQQIRCALDVGWSKEDQRIIYIPRFSFKLAMDGTYCGPFQYCDNGRCVHASSRSRLPRYTQKERNNC